MIQSNSIRGEGMRGIVDATINEILANIGGMFGPGATDAFIVKNDQTYYTRDGKEVLESLLFDNELARKIHGIIFQAAYHQGVDVGDGSTTLAILYCYIYKYARAAIERNDFPCNINKARESWRELISVVLDRLNKRTFAVDEDSLFSMLYTCTQDAELASKLYYNLRDPILQGAYIIPRPSNISTDFNITTYSRPTIKVTTQFSIRPVPDTVDHAVVFYCNGILDVAHEDVFMGMMTRTMRVTPTEQLDLSYAIICHGTTEATRRSLREASNRIKMMKINPANLNNLIILTMDEYRHMEPEELQDIAMIITDEVGMDSVVNPITFETYLYHAFDISAGWLNGDRIDELEALDIDPHCLNQLQQMLLHPYPLMFDPKKGMAIDKPLGPNAQKRYDNLRLELRTEKSSIRRAALQRRMRTSFQMFIDIEVGSSLLKDSQRKFELVLDAIVSSATAVEERVLYGNSLLHTLDILNAIGSDTADYRVRGVLIEAVTDTLALLVQNYTGKTQGAVNEIYSYLSGNESNKHIADFNFLYDMHADDETPPTITVKIPNERGDIIPVTVYPEIVEPYGSIKAILENSTLAIELALTKVFHISGRTGFMNNFITNG